MADSQLPRRKTKGMLNRFGIILAKDGKEKTVYASRRGAVSVKLLSKWDGFLQVLATPMPSFDPDKDFLVAVTSDDDVETIHGTPPAWLIDTLKSDAVLVAGAHQF